PEVELIARNLGDPIDRVDGRLKVTGAARYAAEFPLANLAHAVLVTSSIPNGRVRQIDTGRAERATGVLAVLTPANAPRLRGLTTTTAAAGTDGGGRGDGRGGGRGDGRGGGEGGGRGGGEGGGPPAMRVPTVLQDDLVHYNGQPIGVVIADTFE